MKIGNYQTTSRRQDRERQKQRVDRLRVQRDRIRIRIRIDFIAIRTQGFYVARKRLYNKQ